VCRRLETGDICEREKRDEKLAEGEWASFLVDPNSKAPAPEQHMERMAITIAARG